MNTHVKTLYDLWETAHKEVNHYHKILCAVNMADYIECNKLAFNADQLTTGEQIIMSKLGLLIEKDMIYIQYLMKCN